VVAFKPTPTTSTFATPSAMILSVPGQGAPVSQHPQWILGSPGHTNRERADKDRDGPHRRENHSRIPACAEMTKGQVPVRICPLRMRRRWKDEVKRGKRPLWFERTVSTATRGSPRGMLPKEMAAYTTVPAGALMGEKDHEASRVVGPSINSNRETKVLLSPGPHDPKVPRVRWRGVTSRPAADADATVQMTKPEDVNERSIGTSHTAVE